MILMTSISVCSPPPSPPTYYDSSSALRPSQRSGDGKGAPVYINSPRWGTAAQGRSDQQKYTDWRDNTLLFKVLYLFPFAPIFCYVCQ